LQQALQRRGKAGLKGFISNQYTGRVQKPEGDEKTAKNFQGILLKDKNSSGNELLLTGGKLCVF
jgi:hypothetical protein